MILPSWNPEALSPQIRVITGNRRREDYKAMREMFVDEPLSFDEIIARLKVLETRINAMAKAS